MPKEVLFPLPRWTNAHISWSALLIPIAALCTIISYLSIGRPATPVPPHAPRTLERCANLKLTPGPPPGFHKRKVSDRFVRGTKATLIRNANIWTGGDNGKEVIKGDVLLDGGLIKTVGRVRQEDLLATFDDLEIYNADGVWLTPGIVDIHSHLGVDPSPALQGSYGTDSRKGNIQPWLRALDSLHSFDDAYKLSIAGGVTTANILPGSDSSIAGQGVTIKLRDTKERTPTSKLLEPPYTWNGSWQIDWSLRPRWKQMKHACGENPSSVYGNVRMDNIWELRQGYNQARQIKEAQDTYCAKAVKGEWAGLGEFPQDLKWEALVDVLRGRVKVHVHCYEAVDLDGIVRLTNEFKFPIAAFHHAHETYLVPDLLKKAYGHAPASALFATNARFKREAYRASEFAPRILAEHGLDVAMKSDHPVINSRYLLYEAQQAHYYGLPTNLALASVTSTPARVLGLDYRIGFVREGFDADIVLWDSHPLVLGATPKQVYIDGIHQLKCPFSFKKPSGFQKVPKTPNFDKEAADAVKYDGLPPLGCPCSAEQTVLFTKVKNVYVRDANGIVDMVAENGLQQGEQLLSVVVHAGQIKCVGVEAICPVSIYADTPVQVVDLEGGALSPGLITFGSPLGLEHIKMEDSTRDGDVYDPLNADGEAAPTLLGNTMIRAVDGLLFSSRDALLAYRSGVTVGVTAPSGGFFKGLSTVFSLGAEHKLQKGAIVQDVAALHVAIRRSSKRPRASVSTQIAALRSLLLPRDDPSKLNSRVYVERIRTGQVPLVVEAQSADDIASLILLKKEVEQDWGRPFKLTISGGSEAHLLAKELAEAKIGVILTLPRPFPSKWESRRILPGPPLSKHSAISWLCAHNVTVGIGIKEIWSARSTRFDASWAAAESHGGLTYAKALALASTNLEALLGIDLAPNSGDLVATRGGTLLDIESKVIGVVSPRMGLVDLFDRGTSPAYSRKAQKGCREDIGDTTMTKVDGLIGLDFDK